MLGTLKKTAGDKLEEGGDDVKSSWPLRSGPHVLQWWLQWAAILQSKANPKKPSQFGLDSQLESMKLESLVIVDQRATVNTFSGLVHTARHAMGVGLP